MFDFEKLDVYQEAKSLNELVIHHIFNHVKDDYINHQWKRSTMSIVLNLAEGTSRISSSEKKHFYTVSRSSVFECVAIMDILRGQNMLSLDDYDKFYTGYEKLSKMLLGLFRNVA
jgi:four helix bundle protein